MTGDISDWRQIIVMSETGIKAYLKNMVDPTVELETLISESWQAEESLLLSRIESAVYDHPQVLDDFRTDIVIVTPRTVWMPTVDVEEDDESLAETYNVIYRAEAEDVMGDEMGDVTCAYMLAPGLDAFLQRTFPGARIQSHLGIMARRFVERASDMPRLYVEIRGAESGKRGEADCLLFDGRKMLLCATHTWNSEEDLQYLIYNILDVYGMTPQEVEVSLSGDRDVKVSLMKKLRERITYVMLTMLPGVATKSNLPLSAALLLRN